MVNFCGGGGGGGGGNMENKKKYPKKCGLSRSMDLTL